MTDTFNAKAYCMSMKTWKDTVLEERLQEFEAILTALPEWREGMDAKVAAIIKLQLAIATDADDIAVELVEVGEAQVKSSREIYTAETRIAGFWAEIADRKETANTAKARVALGAVGKNADERKHNLVIALSESEEYQTARRALLEIERIKMVEEALLGEHLRDEKRHKARTYVLKSRLDVLAARLKGE